MTLAITQGPAQSLGGGDQPIDKSIPIANTFHDGSLPIFGTQTSAKEKKMEEPKDSGATLVPSPHVTLVPSPHHSPILPISAIVLQPSGSPM